LRASAAVRGVPAVGPRAWLPRSRSRAARAFELPRRPRVREEQRRAQRRVSAFFAAYGLFLAELVTLAVLVVALVVILFALRRGVAARGSFRGAPGREARRRRAAEAREPRRHRARARPRSLAAAAPEAARLPAHGGGRQGRGQRRVSDGVCGGSADCGAVRDH